MIYNKHCRCRLHNKCYYLLTKSISLINVYYNITKVNLPKRKTKVIKEIIMNKSCKYKTKIQENRLNSYSDEWNLL